MPTYAYACTACGHAFEIVQSFSDDSLSVCPECEGRLRKVFSSVGVVFKGSGFYRNDARAGAKSTALSPAASTPATLLLLDVVLGLLVVFVFLFLAVSLGPRLVLVGREAGRVELTDTP